VQAYEHEKERNLVKQIRLILGSLPKDLVEIAKNFNETINDDSESLRYILINPMERKDINSITVKQLQITLKIALNRVESTDFKTRLGITEFEPEQIIRFRKHCKNAKLRNIYFRLINRDFFTYSRMKKYKMVETDKCPRCGQIETINHLLWECDSAKHIWSLYNKFIANLVSAKEEQILSYNDIYKIGHKSITYLKVTIVQELIQMVRPKNWNEDNVKSVYSELQEYHKHIAIKNYT
jgi:hypothetical protein